MRKVGPRRHVDDVIDFEQVSVRDSLRSRRLESSLRHHRCPSGSRMAGIVGDHITDKIRVHGLYERDELNALDALVLDRLAVSKHCCVDVGANIGNHTIHFSQRFARVVAFEPNPLASELLRWNLRANSVTNVTVHDVGLAEQATEAAISVVPHNLGASHIGHSSPDRASSGNEVARVRLVRGDDVLQDEGSIGLVKIDVEGLEVGVLHGLQRTLEQHRPVVVVEVLKSRIDAAAGRTQVGDMLASLQYAPYELLWRRRSRIRFVDGLMNAIKGSRVRVLRPIVHFEFRDYPMVVFLPREIARSPSRRP